MIIFYLFALFLILLGIILWSKNPKITLNEFFIGGSVALGLAIIFNIIALCNIHNKTSDIQTMSGQISRAKHFAKWKEYYEYAVYRTEYYNDTETYYTTDSKGNRHRHTRTVRKSRRVFDHWEPTSRWHDDHWKAYSNLNTTYDIDEGYFNYFVNKFNNITTVQGDRTTGEHNSRMLEGDPNDYEARNMTGWIEPVTILGNFENRIKATYNIFQFVKVSTNIQIFPWPQNPNWNKSDRIIGTARNYIGNLELDQLNARLGPIKKVNIILVGFGDKDEIYGQYQQSAWLGGKKNDLVICFGGGSQTEKAKWAYCFGWTESELVKRNLETIFLTHPVNNDILNLVESEIKQNYVIKDWHKFDYIKIRPNAWVYWVYFILTIGLQIGLYIYFHTNYLEKDRWNR